MEDENYCVECDRELSEENLEAGFVLCDECEPLEEFGGGILTV